MKKIYLSLAQCRKIQVDGIELHLTNKEMGIVGMMPVFSNKRKAKKWSGKTEVITLEPADNTKGE